MNDPELEAALDAQQTLVESSLPLVREVFLQAQRDRVAHPLVVLIDCEDELGGDVARGWLGDETVNDAIALQHAEQVAARENEAADEPEHDEDHDEPATTVYAHGIAWSEARGVLSAAFPYLEPILDMKPAPEGILVISITAGGASALTAPLSDE
ncbi:hypothetical protein [Botrimarina hoheduenensis]|uniref:Uncharacterized protein n=1 Tax=Botrimarina hoheduenensis TaxID=2528000 RepID=A0A5C5VWP3_9BACT|nr:hypothetical protein [Botrimarina hoheduenensis]TWT42527.1 hypothetical protein Pla111_28320 [Botrimarina hoheduenensis]